MSELADYIKDQQAAGYTMGQLKPLMLQHGYTEAEIAEAESEDPFAGAADDPITQARATYRKRNILAMILLLFITLGIYGIYWLASTTDELRTNGKDAPNPYLLFLLLIPGIGGIIYAYLYGKAYEENVILITILLILFFPAGMALAQSQLNRGAA